MACYLVDVPGGGTAIVCGRLGKHCSCCRRVGSKLCDFPIGGDTTCDAPLCQHHAHAMGENVDYCPTHHQRWLAQEARARGQDEDSTDR